MAAPRVTRLLTSLPRPCSALVVGASGGIGRALVARIREAEITVHAFARHPGPGDQRLDLTDEDSIAAAFAGLPRDPPLRLVIVASGLLHDGVQQPEKSLRALDAGALARSFAVNAIGPALMAKHGLPVLCREGKSVFAVLSARVGSIEDNRIGGWYGYRASKAALNQIIRTLAIEQSRTRPQSIVVALHPGTVATPLSAPFRGSTQPGQVVEPEVAAAHLLAVIDQLFQSDSGGFIAWDGTRIPF